MISTNRKQNSIIAIAMDGSKITAHCDLRTTLQRVEAIKGYPSLYDGLSDSAMCKQVALECGSISYVGPAMLEVAIDKAIATISVFINSCFINTYEIELKEDEKYVSAGNFV